MESGGLYIGMILPPPPTGFAEMSLPVNFHIWYLKCVFFRRVRYGIVNGNMSVNKMIRCWQNMCTINGADESAPPIWSDYGRAGFAETCYKHGLH